ncbi:MAG: hypothetical protein J6S71_06435 [Clostridia bacterium]|nr:hypothetical protein [Clostridia bacterium]
MSSQNGFLRFLSAILSLILAFLLIAAIPLWIIDFMLSEDSIETAADYIFDSLGDVSDLGVNTKKGSKTIADVLLWSIKGCGGDEFITEKQISDSLVPEFLKTITLDIIEDFRNGSDIAIDAEDIYEFLERNGETVSDLAADSGYIYELNIKYNEELILYNVKELIGKNGITPNDLLEDGEFKDNIELYLAYARTALSKTTVYITYGVIGVIVCLLFTVNLGYFRKFLSSCGKPAFTVGLVYFLAALAMQYLRSTINPSSDRFSSAVDFMIGYAAAGIMDVSAAVLIAGLVLLILSVIARKKQDQ